MKGMIIAKNDMLGKSKINVEPKLVEAPEIPKEKIDPTLEMRIFEEIKASIFLAKQFPRDEEKSEERILKLCERERFKETALYSFQRGNEIVEGPTIRFAEALARAWGNIQYSVIELETKDGVSKMLAYAWDVENNTKSTRQFDVSMTRYTKAGTRNLYSFQECYEMKASYGARFLRGCILNLIPNDFIEVAIEKVKSNMILDAQNDLENKKKEALSFMCSKLQVEKEVLENYLNCKYENWQGKELVSLKLAYNGIKEGQFTVTELLGTRKETVRDITDDEIKELLNMDKGKNKLFFFMQSLYKKKLVGQLTSKEYAELKNLLEK